MNRLFLILSIGLCLFIGVQSAHAKVGDLAQCKVYSVNIIAYENCPKQENAQRIAVKADFSTNAHTGLETVDLDRRNTIGLLPGDFRVGDSNACDSDGALFYLPTDSASLYEVWIRLVGPPNSAILNAFLCADDAGTLVCNSGTGLRVRYTGSGEPHFFDATNALLTLGNGDVLFDPDYEEFFWAWDTQGKPHAQVWFVDAACVES